MKKFKVPVNEPHLIGNEKKYLQKCIRDGFVSSSGPFVEKFEKKFAKRLRRKFAISVSSGTAALQLAFESLNIKKKDQVILPSFTIISCILPIIRCGAVPILVDSDPVTWNMDVKKIEDIITSKTKAIIAPHIYGLPIDMDPLLKIAKKYKLKLITDSAQAPYSLYKKKIAATISDVGGISLNYHKHIHTGEGGIIITDDDDLAEIAKEIRSHGQEKRYHHSKIGVNGRLDTIQAAILLPKLKILSEGDLQSCVYYHLRKKLKKMPNWHLLNKLYMGEKEEEKKVPDIAIAYLNYDGETVYPKFLIELKETIGPLSGNSKKGYKNSDYIMKNGMLIACHHGMNKEMEAATPRKVAIIEITL